MTCQIPLSDLDISDGEVATVEKVLRSKWLSMGAVTQEFEESFARFLGVKHAFAVANATAALHLAYAALGAGQGDEVIVPSLTFVATANAVLYTGAQPLFTEIKSLSDLNISPDDIERRITPRTKIICVVHYAGYVCDMPRISAIAQRHGIAVVEDASHAPGATLNGRKAGTFGDVACFSFFANKNITTGEGGMIVTNRDDLAQKIKLMRSHGMTTLTWDRHRGHAYSYDVISLGYNYRIDEIRSALGISQLKLLDERNEQRRRIAAQYRSELSDVPDVSIPFEHMQTGSAQYIFPILLDDPARRPAFIAKLREKGIQTSIHYPPVHLFAYYRERFGYVPGHLPLTEEACAKEVTLPLYPTLDEIKVKSVCDAVRSVLAT